MAGTLRVAIVVPSLRPGGAERVSVNLAEAWATRGWDVHILTIDAMEADFYEFDRTITRHALGLAVQSRGPIHGLALNGRRILELRTRLRAIEPDAVVGMMTTASVLALLATRPRRCPFIAVEHNHPPRLQLPPVWERLRRYTYPLADYVVMLTQESLEWLSHAIPRARGVVIPNAVRYPLPSGDPVLPPAAVVADGERLLLAVGRLADQKGFDWLLEAWSRIEGRHPDWRLVILGDGERRDSLGRQVAALAIGGRTSLPGTVGNVGQWYERADLFVMSSRFEGFPMTLAEAMAHGCAAVSYDCDTGPRDLIDDEQNGLLVRPVGDAGALASALEGLMSDDVLRRRMADRAIAVRDRYAMTRIMSLWDDVLQPGHRSDEGHGS